MGPQTPNTTTVILPCHNEKEAIEKVLAQLDQDLVHSNLNAEIIVVDNASTDGSADILRHSILAYPRLRVVFEPRVGYGSACLKGLHSASETSKYLVIADCDNTYNVGEASKFVKELENGFDLVIGNRFTGKIANGSMPWLHRHFGNPLLSLLVRLFFKVRIGDIHCGMRAITKEALAKITLNTTGMEFASEMIIKASKRNLKIAEISTDYKTRAGSSKLRSFSDGWRHLRFILLYSPLILFFIPGILLFLIGSVSFCLLYFMNPTLFGLTFYVHPIFLSSITIISGYQLVLFAAFARTYAITHLGDKDGFFEPLYRLITIERAGIVGVLLLLIAGSIYAYILTKWVGSGFRDLNEIKNSILALTLTVLGVQTFFSAFMLSILGIKDK